MAVDPTAQVVRNMLSLRRLGNGVAAQAEVLLRELFDTIAAEVARADPMDPISEVWRRYRVEQLVDQLEGVVGAAFDDLYKQVRQAVAEVGAQQARWAMETLRKSTGERAEAAGGVNAAKATIDREPILGDLLAQAFDDQARRTISNLRRVVQQGMSDGLTTPEIVALVRSEDGPFTQSARGVELLVRTSVNQIANQAHLDTYRANGDIVGKVQFVATLDGRTTLICANHDGEVWDLDDPDLPQPPLHWNCRSVLVPVIDWEGLGLDEPPEGTRASMDGQVPASTDFQAWLEDQSREVQDDVLGPTRAKLFRDGKVSLRDMINNDGETIAVSDL